MKNATLKTCFLIITILAATLLLAGCTVTQGLDSGSIESTSLGHTSMVADAGSVSVHASDGTPHYSVFSPEQVEVLSNVPAGSATVSKNGLFLSSPKDTEFSYAKVTFNEDGQVTEAELKDFTTNISEPIRADAETVALFVDYAKALSEDERDKFLGAMEAANTVLAEAIRAAFPVPIPN